jgi:hypothetical protein
VTESRENSSLLAVNSQTYEPPVLTVDPSVDHAKLIEIANQMALKNRANEGKTTKFGPVTVEDTPLKRDLLIDESKGIETSLTEAETAEEEYGISFDRDPEQGFINEFNKPGLRFDANRSNNNYIEIKKKIIESYPGADVLKLASPVDGAAIAVKLPEMDGYQLFDSDRATTLSDWAEGAGYLANTENLLSLVNVLATKNLGLFMRTLTSGLSGGAGKAIDEGIEYLRGYQSDPIEDIFQNDVVPAVLAGVIGESAAAPISRSAKVIQGSGFVKDLTDQEKKVIRIFDEAKVLGPTPGQIVPFTSAMEAQAVATDRRSEQYSIAQARQGLEDLLRLKNAVGGSELTDDVLDQVVEKSIADLKTVVEASKYVTREQGGNALKAGKEAFTHNYSEHLNRKYGKADLSGTNSEFSMQSLDNLAKNIREGVTLPRAGRAADDSPIQLRKYSPRFNEELNKILRGANYIRDDANSTALQKLRVLRTNFFELKTPKPGERMTHENREAAKVWAELTKTMENPSAGSNDFKILLKAANMSNRRYESILEVADIATITKQTNPGKLTNLVQPGNSYTLRTMKRVMPAGDWKVFNDSYKTQILNDPKNIRKTFDKFATDPEALNVMFTKSEQINLLKLSDGVNTLENTISRVKGSRLGSDKRARELVTTGSVDSIKELLNVSEGGKNGRLGRSMRDAVIDEIMDTSREIRKGTLVVDGKKAINKIQELKQLGVLDAVMLPQEAKALEDRELMYSMFMPNPDVGAKLQAAQIVSQMGSVFNPAELVSGVPVWSALQKTLQGVSALTQNYIFGRILLSEAGQRAIRGVGSDKELDVTGIRLASNLVSHVLSQMGQDNISLKREKDKSIKKSD